jgi:hypothetical protein
MQIIDNYGLPSKRNSFINPWLETLLTCVQALSKNNFVLRLTGEHLPNSILYSLQNNQNKTVARICKSGDWIEVKLLSRDLPDPEKEMRPEYRDLGSRSFVCDEKGIKQAAAVICAVLDEETPYSLKSVVKIKVMPLLQINDPWVFRGGRITGVQQSEHLSRIEVENGQCAYTLTPEQVANERVKVRKYLLFNDKGEFQSVSSSEFDFYYEMKYVH